jgi:hypothetical protein
MLVSPWRLVKGAMTLSCPIVTPASITVAAGLTIVTPASMWRSWMWRWASAATSASCTRSLMPSSSSGSESSNAPTVRSCARRIGSTSGR